MKNSFMRLLRRQSLLAMTIASYFMYLPLTTTSLYAANWKSVTREGVSQYKSAKYEEALKDFERAQNLNPKNSATRFNRGCAAFKMNSLEEAIKSFEQSKIADKKNSEKSQSLYNLGNSFLALNKTDEAIEAYKQALLLNPKDADIKHNLAIALKKKQNPENQKDKDKNKNQGEGGDKKDEEKEKSGQPKEEPQANQEQLEALLQAFQDEEMKQARKMKSQSPRDLSVEKDW